MRHNPTEWAEIANEFNLVGFRPDKCTVLVADSIEVERLVEGVLDISSTMEFGTRRDPKDNGKFLPVLRIAQIKVTPHKKEETAE